MDRQLRLQLVEEIECEFRRIKKCLEDNSPVEQERENGTFTFTSDDVYSLRIAASDLDRLQKSTNHRLAAGSILGLAGGATCLVALGAVGAAAGVILSLGTGASVLGGGINFISKRQLSSREKRILERVTGPLQRLCNMGNIFKILINSVNYLADQQAVARHATMISTQQLRDLRIKLQEIRIALEHSEREELLRLGVEIFAAFQSVLRLIGVAEVEYEFLNTVLTVLRYLQGLESTTLEGLRVLVPIAAAHKLNEAKNNLKMAYQAAEEAKKAAEASRKMAKVTKLSLRATKETAVSGTRGTVVIRETTEAVLTGAEMGGTTGNAVKAVTDTGELIAEPASSVGGEVAKSSDDIAEAMKYAKHVSAGVSVFAMAISAYTLYSVYENMNDGSRARFSHELRQIADVIDMTISLDP